AGARPARAAAGDAVPGEAGGPVARQLRVRAKRPPDAVVPDSARGGGSEPPDARLGRSRARRHAAQSRDRRGGRQRAAPSPRTPLDTHPVQAMTRDTLAFLKRLLDTPGPSGFETAPARVWREEVKAFADQVTADVHGNS